MSLTHSDRLVLAMAELEDEFDEWTMTVKAWEMFPDYYGLRGYESRIPIIKQCATYTRNPAGLLAKDSWKRFGLMSTDCFLLESLKHNNTLERWLNQVRLLPSKSNSLDGFEERRSRVHICNSKNVEVFQTIGMQHQVSSR